MSWRERRRRRRIREWKKVLGCNRSRYQLHTSLYTRNIYTKIKQCQIRQKTKTLRTSRSRWVRKRRKGKGSKKLTSKMCYVHVPSPHKECRCLYYTYVLTIFKYQKTIETFNFHGIGLKNPLLIFKKLH